MFNIFKEKKTKTFVPPKYAMFNVEVFNSWFNDKDNGATYANMGIFLRIDKLSYRHIEEYLINCFNIDLKEVDLTDEIVTFYYTISDDWRLKNKLV